MEFLQNKNELSVKIEKKIAIIGSNGQLGWELVNRCRLRNLPVLPLSHSDIDICDLESIRAALVFEKISMVLNAAAYTAVDQAEIDPDTASAVNSTGPGNLAEFCRGNDKFLLHLSTDYVFNGQSDRPYKEDDPMLPLGVYGETKASGEAEVRKILSQHIILRTAWLYGIHGKNFVKTILDLGRRKASVKVVADQYGCPTYAGDLADAILDICEQIGRYGQNSWGTYHYCGRDAMSWNEFAAMIYKSASQYETLMVNEVEQITTSEFPARTKRPGNSVLDCTKIEKTFGIKQRPCIDSLNEMLHAYYKGN